MRSYFYNPMKPSECHPVNHPAYGLEFDLKSFAWYVNHVKYFRKELEHVREICRVSLPNLRAICAAIGEMGREFASTSGQQAMADRVGLSISTVQRGIRGLVKAGLLITFHRYTKDRETRRRTTSLTILKCFSDFCRWQQRVVGKKNNPTPLNITEISLINVVSSGTDLFSFDPETGEIFFTGGGGGKAGMVYQGGGK